MNDNCVYVFPSLSFPNQGYYRYPICITRLLYMVEYGGMLIICPL